MTESSSFQLVGYLKLLDDHHVDYVIVGGVGSRIQGSATTTQDLDIMPNPESENLERLANALSAAGTRKKEFGSTEYVPSFDTSYGILDVLMELRESVISMQFTQMRSGSNLRVA